MEIILLHAYVSLWVPGLTQVIFVGYKSESNDANNSKKEDLSPLFCI